mmetsp:Transcript_74103/g.176521  ORF Transcript_74103/g.176521 Transcript_74103/m.176521 type:complete len:203 (-) Transcript_74103:757-1365(-)
MVAISASLDWTAPVNLLTSPSSPLPLASDLCSSACLCERVCRKEFASLCSCAMEAFNRVSSCSFAATICWWRCSSAFVSSRLLLSCADSLLAASHSAPLEARFASKPLMRENSCCTWLVEAFKSWLSCSAFVFVADSSVSVDWSAACRRETLASSSSLLASALSSVPFVFANSCCNMSFSELSCPTKSPVLSSSVELAAVAA